MKENTKKEILEQELNAKHTSVSMEVTPVLQTDIYKSTYHQNHNQIITVLQICRSLIDSLV